MSESEGAHMSRRRRRRRRRGSSPASPASLLDDDNLLWEILLRLPPQPSSLPRASAVCRRWRRLATDPKFIVRFRAHHPKPPLLGVFHRCSDGITFVPVLDPPDRIPSERFDMRRYGGYYDILGCRHGRVLAMDWSREEVLVCHPVTGEHHRMAVPTDFTTYLVNGAVLCPAADDHGHVHGSCPFKVVLMTMYADDYRPVTCVYSSEAGSWGDLVKTAAPCELDDAGFPGALVGNSIYWLQRRVGKDILVFDMDEPSLTVITGPPITTGSNRIIQAEDGAVGLAVLSYPRFQMWQRNVNCHGVATWMLSKTIEMHNMIGLPRTVRMSTIFGYCEDTDALFIFLEGTVFMVQLKSMQTKRLHETEYIRSYHPFTSYYTPAIAGGSDEAELHDT